MDGKVSALVAACRALSDVGPAEAAEVIRREYPFEPVPPSKRAYGPLESTRVFVRDGFIDRYSGSRLVFPPVLRVVSIALPSEFPYHSNWKSDRTHPAYWQLVPTVDHLIPVSHGGQDSESNWVTTSMARNAAKGNWSLEELGWSLHGPGDMSLWDGLIQWFIDYTAAHRHVLSNQSVRQWRRAADAVLSG